jgi:excinuclease ABC subunit A
MAAGEKISIKNAYENNLKHISLEIPKNKLVVVTGVSGSGKSSLVYDIIFREAENRYLGSFSTYARQFMGKMRRPQVEQIQGLSPAIAIDQKSVVKNPRSTVGTLTGIYDYLRLIFARLGKSEMENPDLKIDRNLFSFNNPKGACPKCKGLGLEDRIDPNLLVEDKSKSLRQGALVITTPSGYIIYSQVTMEVLNQVCESEGFNVDIPWKNLSPEQKHIVLYGSNKIEIPFGKHTLESRMRWSGITAKPRETGFYKGILPIMENILLRDRNKNILRFARSERCSACDGQRLNAKALSVKWQGKNIAEISGMSLKKLDEFLSKLSIKEQEKNIARPLIEQIQKRCKLLERLGCSYLTSDRESGSLSGGESQRLHLAAQLTSQMRAVLYIFDEPSIGLHPSENQKMLEILRELRDKGNTVIVVEHEEDFIRAADHVIDIGPGAGVHGGELILNSALRDVNPNMLKTSSLGYLEKQVPETLTQKKRTGTGEILIKGANENNLKNIDVSFKLKALNVLSGVSGAGKSSLTENILARFLKNKLNHANLKIGLVESISGWEPLKKIISIDQSPIGRTPRSNPATYTKLFDEIRDLFASQPASKEKGWKKNRFSFNVSGGRCEGCQGAGYMQIGMHFMGNVEILCEKCNGQRFKPETLEIKFKGKNIFDVLEMPIEQAIPFFEGQKKILRYLETLAELGLGYLTLGQRSTTLSGGEAQRVKLASELARPASAHCLYILDEPTTGLHNLDVAVLLKALQKLIDQGNTVLVIEHHLDFIAAADHIVDLGPGSGEAGGTLVASGIPLEILKNKNSLTGKALKKKFIDPEKNQLEENPIIKPSKNIIFKGISTNNLKKINIDFPAGKINVVTGVSGSGKSSLAFDTLYAEGRNRFLESYSAYIRSRIGMQSQADFEEVQGLRPTMSISRKGMKHGPRSILGTMTGIYDLFRLLFARIGKSEATNEEAYSSLFSFNHEQGACKCCDGLGQITVCDTEKLVSDPAKSLADGAMDASKTGKFYGDIYGQYVPTLLAVGKRKNIDFSKAWQDLNADEKQVAMFGSGDETYKVEWVFKRGKSEGKHEFEGKWLGFANLVEEEYVRKHADQRGKNMLDVMQEKTCPNCKGGRLNAKAMSFKISKLNIAELSALNIDQALKFFDDFENLESNPDNVKITAQLRSEICERLNFLDRLGLSYLSPDRNSETLSGGEAQRVRLAAQLGNVLSDMVFVLDEPTLGLHPTNVENLMALIRELHQNNNTLVIVEHDRDVIQQADHIIELGPGAGRNGGQLIAQGSLGDIAKNPDSITGKYFRLPSNPIPEKRKILKPGLTIEKAFANNLKEVEIQIPSGGIVALTGVSGSGKSSLMFDVIGQSWHQKKAIGCKKINGFEKFEAVIELGQNQTSGSQAGNAATFMGVFDAIRDLFSKTEAAKKRKLSRKDFSFNTKGGRCELCQGQGKITVSMDFIADVEVVCELCHGKRYTDQILSCQIKGKNISNVLQMSILEGLEFFKSTEKIKNVFQVLLDTGLDYLEIGQATNSLSGGEMQRLKLARELVNPAKGKKLYLLDEPGTGLHFEDIRKLNLLFRQLADKGNTLLIIEHDSDIILQTDWLIDMGPGGGEHGGEIVAEGRPEEIAKNKNSLTGQALRKWFLKS